MPSSFLASPYVDPHGRYSPCSQLRDMIGESAVNHYPGSSLHRPSRDLLRIDSSFRSNGVMDSFMSNSLQPYTWLVVLHERANESRVIRGGKLQAYLDREASVDR